MHKQVHILSTKFLPAALIDFAQQNNIVIEAKRFITTSPVINHGISERILNVSREKASVIFTSNNAVTTVAAFSAGEKPTWDIYCIENSTKALISKHFPGSRIKGIAGNAKELAAKIIEDELNTKLIFFCGDKRREDLPVLLNEKGIALEEIIVYQTLLVPQKIENSYEGIMFFSPSAVESYFSVNNLSLNTVIFAIGNTTAVTIKNFSANRVITADEASMESLVKKIIEHFSSGASNNED